MKKTFKMWPVYLMLLPFIPMFVLAIMQFYGYKFFYNETPSERIGIYFLSPGFVGRVDEKIAFIPTKKQRQFMLDRQYIALRNIVLIKTVAGIEGQNVCVSADNLSKNVGEKIVHINSISAPISVNDSKGRSLISVLKDGCTRLATDHFFVIGSNSPYSYDSRYFGTVEREQILGTVKPVWTW